MQFIITLIGPGTHWFHGEYETVVGGGVEQSHLVYMYGVVLSI